MKNKDNVTKEIASERIELLFDHAKNELERNPSLSHTYVRTLKKIGSHYKVPIPKHISNNICTKCNMVLEPGITATVRVVSSKGYVSYKCAKCGKEKHIFIKNKVKP